MTRKWQERTEQDGATQIISKKYLASKCTRQPDLTHSTEQPTLSGEDKCTVIPTPVSQRDSPLIPATLQALYHRSCSEHREKPRGGQGEEPCKSKRNQTCHHGLGLLASRIMRNISLGKLSSQWYFVMVAPAN